MPRLIAIQEVRYASVNCVPGTPTEQFEASETDAVLLKAIGKAKDAPASGVEGKNASDHAVVARPSQEQAQAKAQQAQPANPPGRRRYMRRDMTAED